MGCAKSKDADDAAMAPFKSGNDSSGPGIGSEESPNGVMPNGVAASGSMQMGEAGVPVRASVPEGVCPGCMKPYDKYSMKIALGNTWHPECFKCPKCGEKVVGTDVYEHEGLPYHEECHAALFNPDCDVCGKMLDEQYIKAAGKNLHPECLNCNGCKDNLVNKKIMERDRTFYCEKCFALQFKEPCKKCGKSIVGEHVEALEGRFHPECLTCETCQVVLSSVEFREFKNKVYCLKHVPQPTRRMLVICSMCGETDYRKADHIDIAMMDSLLCRRCEKDHQTYRDSLAA